MGFDRRIAGCYVTVMSEFRSHPEIIDAAIAGGTAVALAARLGERVTPQNLVDWRRRGNIPADRWKRFVDLGFTSYGELAAHVAPPPSPAMAEQRAG